MILLILPLLLGNFVERWFFPQGISGFGNTKMQILDTDRDTHLEFVFTTYGSWPPYVYIYELHPPDNWEVDSVPYPYAPLLWDSGDFDFDGLLDLVMQCGNTNPYWVGITVFESPDSFSYPTQEVWRDTVGQAVVTPICAYDIDQDGLQEIVKVGANGIDFVIYESIANNLYGRIYEDTIQGILTPSSTIAFGDFDADSKVEFVLGNLSDGTGAAYWLYESPADNTYEFICLGSVPTGNIKDCFSVPDADGDGKLEFVVKGFVIPTAEIHAFIFEATGDNTYEIIKTFTLSGGDYYGGYSDVGDVDGDGIPEIALEGRQTVYIIKAAGNDSFYVWETLPGNSSGSSVRVYDVDGNGLSEVIISGNNQTRIYEYQVGIAEETVCDIQGTSLTISPNPTSNSTMIRCQITGDEQKYEMKIYDIAGRLVTDLSGQMSGRSNQVSVRWDGVDLSGRRLPAGVYFLEFQAGDYRTTEKLLLIR